jgi:hypothetical protein
MVSNPKYHVGDVIDIRYSKDELPNRIVVYMVYFKDGCQEWMYQCYSEKNYNKLVYLTESYIDKLKSRKTAKCYEHPMIQDLYKKGYRFCGNGKEETMRHKAISLQSAKYISNIILCDAISKNGELVDGELGLWIRYYNPIEDTTFRNHTNTYYKVK